MTEAQRVHGNLEGIRDSIIAQLAELYQYEMDEDRFLPRDLMKILARFTGMLNREIALYITRDGEIVDVCVGTDRDVELRDFSLRRSQSRLSCVRCVHTHPGGDGRLSEVDLSALKSFRYDSMVAVGVKNGEPVTVQASFLVGEGEIMLAGPVMWYKLPEDAWMQQILESDALVGRAQDKTSEGPERAVLMGIESQESLRELRKLAQTAGAAVVQMFLQKRDKPDTATFIGRGRAEELALQCQALEADLVIFDEELSGIQVRNLEQMLRVRVIDRTTLILDIFAQRASSSEGKLQVELAQLEYQSARLLGMGTVLSRLGGGIGTRGPGESKLEMNRRRIRERMTELRRRLDEVERQRDIRRKQRVRREIPVVALVGYTNAGKSTLLNHLTDSQVLAEDKLFATLDAVSRRVEDGKGQPFLLVDTVGFIRKLPHTLVKAFRSTLEEAAAADVLVLVHDGSSPDVLEQKDTVEEVLAELGAVEQPRLHVINKCDLIEDMPIIPGGIPISAKAGTGLETMLEEVRKLLRHGSEEIKVFVPFAEYGKLSRLRELGRVLSENYTDEGSEVSMVVSAGETERIGAQLGLRVQKA